MDEVVQQLSLFEEKSEERRFKPELPPESPSSSRSVAGASLLTGRSSINTAIRAFEGYMRERGFTDNTREAFLRDMQLFADYVGVGAPLSKVSNAQLKAFLHWMKYKRGVPCSDKTLARRITTLKVFFGWLAEAAVLPDDPAAPLIYRSVERSLPTVLTTEQVEALLAVTQAHRAGLGERKPDPRPHTLVTLLLYSGIKKSECVNIHLNHLDLSDPAHPELWIRYAEPRYRYKERKIVLPARWTATVRDYLRAYPVKDHLFPWTARNLEYVLRRVGKEAGLPRLTFEILRWTCALRDYIAGMERDVLRHKLGLSKIRWSEWEPTLALLAQRYGGA